LDSDNVDSGDQPEAMSEKELAELVHKAQQAQRDRKDILHANQKKKDFEETWEKLCRHYMPGMQYYASCMLQGHNLNHDRIKDLAEEIVQEAIFRTTRRILAYELRPEVSFQAWLNGIVKNVCQEKLRELRKKDKLQSLSELPEQNEPMVPDQQEVRLNTIIVKQALAEESKESQWILAQCLIHGRPHKDVAAEIGKSVGAVKMMIKRFRQKLRELCKIERSKTTETVPGQESSLPSQQLPDNPT
jgi:RNA polymerase sigma factor (sigma-70 family)